MTPDARPSEYLEYLGAGHPPLSRKTNHTLRAHFRLQEYRAAAAVFQRNAEYNAPAAGFDLYYLAMGHHHAGDKAKARDCFERAVRWHEENEGALSADTYRT